MELGSPIFWERLRRDPAALAHEICSIDLTDLQATLQHHPALRAWVNAVYEASRIEEERCKWELTKARAHALLKAKQTADPDTHKAKVVAVLDAEAETDEGVVAAQVALLSVQEKRAAMKAMADALEDRLQMLVQLAARLREEMREYR